MLQLTSPAFVSGDVVPDRYTCAGEGVAPPLSWRDVPAGTRSLALVMEDPDAPGGTFTHWLVANLPLQPAQIDEGGDLRTPASAGAGPVQGRNDFGEVGYGGPCPPRGHGAHRYQFRLYALDDVLDLEPAFTRDDLAAAIGGHVIEETDFLGVYGRDG